MCGGRDSNNANVYQVSNLGGSSLCMSWEREDGPNCMPIENKCNEMEVQAEDGSCHYYEEFA
jgi:hypothetical protein